MSHHEDQSPGNLTDMLHQPAITPLDHGNG